MMAAPVRVEIAICPTCGEHVEWQGNDWGYWHKGSPGADHPGVDAVLVAGTFTPDPTASESTDG